MPRRLCLLVTDHYNQSVLRFDAGTGTFVDEFIPPSTDLAFPVGVAVGHQGDIYVTSVGVFLPPPPPKIMGVLRFRGTNGAFVGVVAPHGVNDLIGPSDLKFGPDGHLYVGTGFLYLWPPVRPAPILRFDGATGAFIDAFVPAGSGGLGVSRGFAFGPDGNLYVCNWTQEWQEPQYVNRGGVLRFNGATGAFIDVFIPVETENVFSGIAFGPDGNLYVSSGNRILRFNGTTGAFMDVFVSGATSPLDRAFGLIFGANGSLYVCSSKSAAVLRYNSATGAYLDALIPPKASVPRNLLYLALAEMDFPLPYYAEWQFVPRYLWAIVGGFILGALAGLALPRPRQLR
jgi:sugar lactone lactonase YvrE